MRRTYLKYKYTQADKNRIIGNTSETRAEGNTASTSWEEDTNYLMVPESVVSIINIFPFSDKGNLNLFDVRYQMRLNDLYDFS